MKSENSLYERIYEQLCDLLTKTHDPISRMSTIVSVLHHKNKKNFWTGFYRLVDGDLIVGPYQGSLACLVLKKHTGVCWASVDEGKSIVVPDVHKFKDHIACDARSNSEIVIPVRNENSEIVAVLDVDSTEFAAFDEEDRIGLEKIVKLIHSTEPYLGLCTTIPSAK